ncbi:hypothetical protein STRAU_7658 [Streptomyces aurantiacus JA 4570]|uniref:Uncharacterized protein n=1 Tax=Streptomyces aurantiacus JA 4570 TaxID=1286094 RepID=S3ZLZ6_9ACTN|nr:hypothetical protein STRAU_7658 [Streptomyces aurantiacus JA 4570]
MALRPITGVFTPFPVPINFFTAAHPIEFRHHPIE